MHPEFIAQLRPLLGSELPAFLAALEERPALALRVNRLRPGMERFSTAYSDGPVPWYSDAVYLKQDVRPGKALAHELGAYYLQEASAMVSAAVLDARPGERVLDLCAAPGGKTGQLAAALRGEGLLISNEPIPNRAKILAENLERLGVVNAIATCAYPDHLAERWPGYFDAVLVDAPCSGEGMFRREPASREEWQPGSPEGCARRQADILDSAARMVKPGGRLVYSTCTFNRFENEGSIEGFLVRHPEFRPEDFHLNGIGESVDGCLRVWPHRVRGDGHFVARLRRDLSPSESVREVKRSGKADRRPSHSAAPAEEKALLSRLESEVCLLPEVLRGGRPIRQGDYIHLLPAGAPELDTIRTVKPGLCLMRVGRSHIQPMPALAHACSASSSVPNLATPLRTHAVDEETALRVLNGERLGAGESKRYPTLITCDDLPICWQKL